MAATRLIALHINKGKTIAQTLADRTDYSKMRKRPRAENISPAMSATPGQRMSSSFCQSGSMNT